MWLASDRWRDSRKTILSGYQRIRIRYQEVRHPRRSGHPHDGRAETMADVLKEHNPDDKHGRTSNLTDTQIEALAEFVLSL